MSEDNKDFDDDDEEMKETPKEVIEILGFDPLEKEDEKNL